MGQSRALEYGRWIEAGRARSPEVQYVWSVRYIDAPAEAHGARR
ncbi:MAG: hypothetical protein WBD05_04635 [Phycisphaerae bacterium]